MSNIDTNGKRLNLFPMKKKKKKVSSNQAFDMMESVADKSSVNLLKTGEIDKSTKGIHNALMAAGMTPAYGNVADLVDATLYALEGEFGEAAWAAASAIPIIGQMVAGKRALKIAKESGEEMVTVYRGIQQWHKRDMIKKGKFVGGGSIKEEGGKKIKNTAIWVADKREYSHLYTKNWTGWGEHRSWKMDYLGEKYRKRGYVLEFEMPKSYFDKFSEEIIMWGGQKNKRIIFQEGIPKEFLKKVHK